MNDLTPTGKNGLPLLVVSILGKIIALFIQLQVLQAVATVVSIAVGTLGFVHYSIVIFDRFTKKKS